MNKNKQKKKKKIIIISKKKINKQKVTVTQRLLRALLVCCMLQERCNNREVSTTHKFKHLQLKLKARRESVASSSLNWRLR